MKKSYYKFFIMIMLLSLFVIGILQFFELPKSLDYILLVLAIIFGAIGIYKKVE